MRCHFHQKPWCLLVQTRFHRHKLHRKRKGHRCCLACKPNRRLSIRRFALRLEMQINQVVFGIFPL